MHSLLLFPSHWLSLVHIFTNSAPFSFSLFCLCLALTWRSSAITTICSLTHSHCYIPAPMNGIHTSVSIMEWVIDYIRTNLTTVINSALFHLYYHRRHQRRRRLLHFPYRPIWTLLIRIFYPTLPSAPTNHNHNPSIISRQTRITRATAQTCWATTIRSSITLIDTKQLTLTRNFP
jgi:hypothetical protein